jgi:hypothetical protein
MACIPVIPASCALDAAGGAIGTAAQGVMGNAFADAMRDGATWVIKTTVGWWIDVPAIDLAGSPASTIRSYVLWLAAAVATGGLIWRAMLLVLSRRPEHALDVGRGLFVLAFWAAVGIVGPAAALSAGDSFSSWVLDEASGGQASDRLVHLASLDAIDSAGAVILFGLLMMIVGLVQAVLMIFRESALVILAGVVVLAAAGSFTTATRPWLSRVIGWMLALICYKPAAALVYASAITMVGEGNDPRTVVVGLVMMLLAVVALPALMKFFTWASGSVNSGGGQGMAALAGASAAAIHAKAAFSSSGSSASGQAAHISNDLGPTVAKAMPSGAATTSTSAAAGTASAQAGAAAGPAGMALAAAPAVLGGVKRAGRSAGDAMTGEGR